MNGKYSLCILLILVSAVFCNSAIAGVITFTERKSFFTTGVEVDDFGYLRVDAFETTVGNASSSHGATILGDAVATSIDTSGQDHYFTSLQATAETSSAGGKQTVEYRVDMAAGASDTLFGTSGFADVRGTLSADFAITGGNATVEWLGSILVGSMGVLDVANGGGPLSCASSICDLGPGMYRVFFDTAVGARNGSSSFQTQQFGWRFVADQVVDAFRASETMNTFVRGPVGVPEPGILSLVGLGAGLLVMRRRFRTTVNSNPSSE